jgi:hypothetical protein
MRKWDKCLYWLLIPIPVKNYVLPNNRTEMTQRGKGVPERTQALV